MNSVNMDFVPINFIRTLMTGTLVFTTGMLNLQSYIFD